MLCLLDFIAINGQDLWLQSVSPAIITLSLHSMLKMTLLTFQTRAIAYWTPLFASITAARPNSHPITIRTGLVQETTPSTPCTSTILLSDNQIRGDVITRNFHHFLFI